MSFGRKNPPNPLDGTERVCLHFGHHRRDAVVDQAMLQYQPPKSSVWGHSLRKMRADRARALFKQFLDTAVGEHTWSASWMRGHYAALTESEFAEALQAVIHEESLRGRSNAVLAQTFEISQWRIDGQLRPTHSTMTLHYGAAPLIGTRLQFESMDQFSYIKRVLEDLRICKLNGKLLRPKTAITPKC